MTLPLNFAPELEARANDDGVIMPTPACIAPTLRVMPGQMHSSTCRVEIDDYLMRSSSNWTDQEHGDDTLARDAAREDVVMLSLQDWGVDNQRDAEDPRYTVTKSSTSSSRSRQPTS